MKHMYEGRMALVPGEYQRLLASQNGGCAICGKRPRRRYLAVDHCHTCGKVRGLLCYYCNSALGVWEFDEPTTRRAAEYLQRVREDMLSHPLVEPNTLPKVQDSLPF